jgi:Type II secretion system (T2SS), protein E, N-terminal domain
LPILGRILRDRGIVSERQLEEAVQHQVLYGGRLGTNLFELGLVTEERLQEALAKAHGVPVLHVDFREIDPSTVALLPKALVAKHKIFPYKLKGKTLFVLMVDPGDHNAVAQVGFSRGYIMKPFVVPEFRMIQLLRDYYGVDERWRFNDTHRPKTPVAVPSAAPRLDPDAAAARIDTATTRDEIVESFMALCHRHFRRVIFFIVREPWLLGWSAVGEDLDPGLVESLRIPLDQPSVFQTVIRDKSVFVGRMGPDEENQRFLRAIGKRPQTNAAVFPIMVKGRAINLIYGDSGPAGNVKANLGDLIVLVQKVSRAYLRVIRLRIAETRRALGTAKGEDENEDED